MKEKHTYGPNDVSGVVWAFFVFEGLCWPSLAVIGCCGPSLAVIGCCGPSWTCVGCCGPLLAFCHIPYLTSNTSSPTPTFRTYLRPLLRCYFYLTSPDPFRCYATIIIVSLHFYLPLLSPVPYCPLLSPYLVTSDLHSDLHSYLQHPRIIILIIYPLVTCSDHLRITPSCPHI